MLSRLVITFLPRSKHLLISWLQSPSAVILEPRKIKSATVSTLYPSICHEVMGPDAMILVFWMLSFKPTLSLSSFTYIRRLFSSSSLSPTRVVSSAYLRLLIFLLAILIPACASSSPVFLMMYSAYKLNKQGDNIQPWCTPFPVWNQSVVPCPVLTVASWPAYRFLKRAGQVVCYTVVGCNLKNDRMISVRFEGKPFNITVIQVYALTSNAEEAEVEWFSEDVEDLLELTPKKHVLCILGLRNEK